MVSGSSRTGARSAQLPSSVPPTWLFAGKLLTPQLRPYRAHSQLRPGGCSPGRKEALLKFSGADQRRLHPFVHSLTGSFTEYLLCVRSAASSAAVTANRTKRGHTQPASRDQRCDVGGSRWSRGGTDWAPDQSWQAREASLREQTRISGSLGGRLGGSSLSRALSL